MRYNHFFLYFVAAAAFLASACSESTEETTEVSEPSAPTTAVVPPAGPDGKRQLTPEEQKIVVDQLMQAKAKQQAEGLGSGSVEVNGAWNYTGYSYLSPDPNAAIEARLVAVDITLSGHTSEFDLDDVEIVDGVKMISYGSDPHAEYLTLEGKLMGPDDRPAAPPLSSRWLLIYAFPKNTATFHLYYWGKQLTPQALPIAERGMQLPYPEQVE